MKCEEQNMLWHLVETRDITVQRTVRQLEDKERVIQHLNETLAESQSALAESQLALAESQASLIEKESIILALSRAVTAYRLARLFSFAWVFKKIVRRVRRLIAPRLGNLNQYGPIPLSKIPVRAIPVAQDNLPTISIVTPSFQHGRFIERTIQSVLDQSYPNLQYFVQDGGSKDGTIDVLKQYEGKLFGWASEKDSGQSQAINHGFVHTDGDIMAWLNSDDLLLPGALHTVADYFKRHPAVDVVYGNRLMVDESDREIGRWILPGHESGVLSWADYVPQETLFWRRRIWEKVGGKIDESFRFAMDWDLLVRFRDAGARFGHIPQFLGAFRIHEHQKTSAAIDDIGHQEMDYIRERILGRVPSRKEIRKAVRPYLIKHIAVDMIYRVKKRLEWKI